MLLHSHSVLTSDNFPAYLNERLAAYYPAGIPSFAQERLDAELACVEASQSVDRFLLCHTLNEAAKRCSQILWPDSISIGSLLIFLLTESRINPLPAHYYCPDCGHYELAEQVTFGSDLPVKQCPNCDVSQRRDGFRIPLETVWRNPEECSIASEYRASEGFFSFGYHAVKDFYAAKNCAVIPMGSVSEDYPAHTKADGIYILPEGKSTEDYPQFAAYLADGSPCFIGDHLEMEHCGFQKIILADSKIAGSIYRAQLQSGVFCADIPTDSLFSSTSRDLTNTMHTSSEERTALQKHGASFHEMACALTLPYNAYGIPKNHIESLDILRHEAFKNCPLYCREDVFDRLVANGFDREQASVATYAVRTGHAAHRPEILESLGAPADLVAMARHCLYLFTRGYGAQKLVSLLILAHYMKMDPKQYFSVISP